MNDVFMNTYHRLPVTFVKGNGAYLTDAQGREYLDFTSGIAVNCLGHNHPDLVQALGAQAARLIHVSNYFQSDASVMFAEKLTAISQMRRVFFCNSGAEANEGAIKIARKYSLKKYGPGRHTIVTLRDSFHGRTITTLSATGQEKFHVNFGPFTEGFTFIPPNNIEALEQALDKTVAGLFLEPIQGESGVHILSDEYLRRAAELCAEKDIVLMFDEIQSGLGRTGAFLASEHAGVRGDVVTLAKGLAAGIPVGAVLAGEKTCAVLETGDHGSTFGGNALAAAAGVVVLEKLAVPSFLAEITALGEYLLEGLRALNSPVITGMRGRGLIAACDLTIDARPVLERLISRTAAGTRGLLLLQGGPQTLRFLPPYIISRGQIDEGLALLNKALS
ncbi:MAG: acetylornithine/succinylornithine family transaminase [Spirochaetaceae bacterium]|jgi:acetylornithine/N-succinyldiaminopimelate aminotransferase|nr:acetylornithine/succinylornithine family transaminase [Spirochaetaceae bacterium]